MKKTAFFSTICLVSGLFLGNAAFGQTTAPNVAPVKPATAPVVKKDKNQKEDPNATLNGEPSLPSTDAPAAAPIKPKKSHKVDPADIKPVDMSKVETAKPGEKPVTPQATGTPFGQNRPVAGQKTVESAPLKKPADLKPVEVKN